jgi:dihydrofolate synthase/folylpolyglutamate synthase
MPVDELREIAEEVFGEERVAVEDRLDDALDTAVALADAEAVAGGGVGVLVTGSVVAAGEARTLLSAR